MWSRAPESNNSSTSPYVECFQSLNRRTDWSCLNALKSCRSRITTWKTLDQRYLFKIFSIFWSKCYRTDRDHRMVIVVTSSCITLSLVVNFELATNFIRNIETDKLFNWDDLVIFERTQKGETRKKLYTFRVKLHENFSFSSLPNSWYAYC